MCNLCGCDCAYYARCSAHNNRNLRFRGSSSVAMKEIWENPALIIKQDVIEGAAMLIILAWRVFLPVVSFGRSLLFMRLV